MSDNLAIKIRKNKKGITYYCRIWNSLKQNTDTITLGKKTDDFTITQASEKYEKIKSLYSRGIFNYKPYLLLENKQKEISSLTLLDVFDKYYIRRLKELKERFLESFKDEYNVNKTNIEENVTFKRKMGSFNSRKASYYNHILFKTHNNRNDLYDIAILPFKSITKFEVQDTIDRIEDKSLNIKTIENIKGEFQAIINFGIKEFEIEMPNPFVNIRKNKVYRKKSSKRERILNEEELRSLFTELDKFSNRNAFVSALMGFCFTSRSETVLNIRKKDFNVKIDEDGKYLYDMVTLKNLKNPKLPYNLPLPNFLGRFFYQYLLDHKLDEYVLRPKRKGSRHKIPQPLISISEDYYTTATRLFFFDNILKNLNKDLQDVKAELKLFRKECLKMYHKLPNGDYNLELKKEQISDLVKYENEIEDKMKLHLKELKSNQTHKNKFYFDFHSLRHQSSTEIAKVNYFYCSYCLSHSDKSEDDEITRRYSKIDLDDLREVLTQTYSQHLEKIISNTIEMSMYNYHTLSHKHIYETQYHIKNTIEYKANRGKDLLDRIKIARANNDVENNPEFIQEITPQLESQLNSYDKYELNQEKELNEMLEAEKLMRDNQSINYEVYKKLEYNPFS